MELKELGTLALDIEIQIRVGFELAEQPAECEMFIRRRVLAGEEQDLMLHQKRMNPFRVLRSRRRQAEAADLGAQRPGESIDLELC